MSELVTYVLLRFVQWGSVVLLIGALLSACEHREFFDVAKEQMAQGYKWKEIPCRQVTPDIPAITIDTPTNKKLVCNAF